MATAETPLSSGSRQSRAAARLGDELDVAAVAGIAAHGVTNLLAGQVLQPVRGSARPRGEVR